MDTYRKILKDYLAEEKICYGVRDSGSLLEMLYWNYMEENRMETGKIDEAFAALAHILRQLPLKDHDEVWDLTCGLCVDYQKTGFCHGIRVGLQLGEELRSEE